MDTTWLLLGVAAVLALLASRTWSVLKHVNVPWKRPLGIVFGGILGVAVSLPLAALMNPLVGLQRGTFHNLAILGICLGLLGFVVGSLGGLVYAGMILSDRGRRETGSALVSGEAERGDTG